MLSSIRQIPKFSYRFFCNPLLYNLLKVDKNATQQQIKNNYYKECLIYHPDLNHGAVNKFLEINKAFQILQSKRNIYDELDPIQYQEFLGIWNINFHKNKSKIEELEQYVRKGGILGYFYSKLIGHYNKVIIYDQQKVEKSVSLEQLNHIYFIQDVSSSMGVCDEDSNYHSVPKKFTRKDYSDGNLVSYFYSDPKYDYIIKQSRFIYKSLKNIKTICEELDSFNYLTSFMIFAKKHKILWQYQPVNLISSNIDNMCRKFPTLKNAEFSHIYDSLKLAINDVKSQNKLPFTTFVLITDGLDFKSYTELSEILKIIKDVNIIILTINVNDTKDLKAICDNAKSGRLLKIGNNDNYGFNTFEDCFAKTKELILHNSKISTINIKREFNL